MQHQDPLLKVHMSLFKIKQDCTLILAIVENKKAYLEKKKKKDSIEEILLEFLPMYSVWITRINEFPYYWGSQDFQLPETNIKNIKISAVDYFFFIRRIDQVMEQIDGFLWLAKAVIKEMKFNPEDEYSIWVDKMVKITKDFKTFKGE